MLGAIIGDIVGSRFEFDPTNDYDFELFTNECGYTDDTICTVAVSDAILSGKDYGQSIHEWCRRYPLPMGGYGSRFSQWVMSEHPVPYNSFGNGSAMRVSAIGWWLDDVTALCDEATKSASCSHNHPEGVQGAIAVALAIRDCRMRNPSTAADLLHDGLLQAVSLYYGDVERFNVNIEEHRNRFDETCRGTVPVALAIINNSIGFEDAIRQAVSLGADADTIGAIVGSIAEAIWGIPDWIKDAALMYLPEEMKRVVGEFQVRLSNRDF